jgi:adenine/guanine phosphoribosyltransferase-like PRPP-binding protein
VGPRPRASRLVLPIRKLADGLHGLASLIINQASFAVQDALATDFFAQRIERFEPDVVVGLPTLSLTLASAVARKRGRARYVPLGTSRKV